MDRRLTYVTNDARIIAYEINETTEYAIKSFGLDNIESKLLSQTFLATLMLCETIKNKNDRIALHIEGSGAIGGLYAESDAECRIRGYVKNHPLDFGKQIIHSISDVIGAGFMTVIKQIEGAKEPSSSSVMLETGLIPNDTALFFRESEQRNTVVAMWVEYDKDHNFVSSRGLFAEALPSADDENLKKLESICIKLAEKKNSGDMKKYIEKNFAPFAPVLLEEKKIEFFCPCSREKFVGFIRSMNEKEKKKIIEEGKPIEIECQYCGRKYTIDTSSLL